ncbi:MAG: hypothetical protein KTR29_08905, partial [Rhodothermaceae bacterium]|nr:hypothetical protein [Rhodothermaceae bacterium]
MNISVTVPQIFYDLIARILPGFLFLVVYQGIFSPLGLALPVELGDSGSNFVGSLLTGIGYSGICYFVGWVLTAFTLGSKSTAVKRKHTSKDLIPSMSEMYHEIRLLNSGEGFRI